ncbi:MAG: glutamate synthase large subunit [Thermaerobacter sp.]|nr:glutamate synthase large subunit [Thermaerobacter sp.]
MLYPIGRMGGLYDPSDERDACGVGFAATLRAPSHELLRLGLTALERVAHRGAVGGDGATGDGAGIMTQLPRRLFARELAQAGIPGVDPDRIAVGVLFLPQDESERADVCAEIEAALGSEAIGAFHWREVPVRSRVLGENARRSAPAIFQLLALRPSADDERAFERRIYRARRRIERAFAARGAARDDLYISSFSSRTVVYKGLLSADQLAHFYVDLGDPLYETQICLFHQRFSTNTAPNWSRVQPFRRLAHNGEINTLRGNVQAMRARLPGIIDPHTSDSGMLDNAAEYLHLFSDRDLRHVLMMLVPEAWEAVADLPPERRAFYRYHACLMEPWDGPAALAFTDGTAVGTTLDRNGLRPMRYTIAEDGLVVAGSEAGIFDIPPERVLRHGKLGPGQMLAVDVVRKVVLEPEANKADVCARQPYGRWLASEMVTIGQLEIPLDGLAQFSEDQLATLQSAFAYTSEEIAAVLRPMVQHGKPPNGAMGDDTPHAVLSDKERPLFHYFKQRFAEVTNPPIDHLRESLVFSIQSRIGPRGDILQETPAHARLLELPSPLLTDPELAAIRNCGAGHPAFRHVTVQSVFPVAAGSAGLRSAIERICGEAEEAVAQGAGVIVLSDRAVCKDLVPIPSLLSVAAVHHHLILRGLRMRASLIVESGEPREVHHVAALLGYGANAVNPYLAMALVRDLAERGRVRDALGAAEAERNYRHALEDGLRKVMSRMGVSTVDGYIGAQIFEAVGIGAEVIAQCFPGTASAVGGIGFEEIAQRMLAWHRSAFQTPIGKPMFSGFYQFRKDGERHAFSPDVVAAIHAAIEDAPADPLADQEGLQHSQGYQRYQELRTLIESDAPSQIRDLLALRSPREPVPLAQVEPIEAIVRRFSTGSMSLGSLSPEAHETLAIAMNRLGGVSGSGEGGEDPLRLADERSSGIKQVASARFGVTPSYLVFARELQVKMAQGSKPGEGGQISGNKVTDYVAQLRHTAPGVTLISPPPHHDIYSIEDLAQLIYDLRQINPDARISVKLVAESGVGIIAAGVAKCHADVILISGHSGGTGNSPLDSMKNAGVPWEIGLAETQQTLLASGLRGRVAVRVDGGLRTGKDVLIAALLGADEFSFGTAAMVAEGCTMMRICHTDNCPVGVATQKASLRAKFTGTPEKVMRYFVLVAHEVRELLAALGFYSLDEVTGRTDLLTQRTLDGAAGSLDLQALLHVPPAAGDAPRRHQGARNLPPIEDRLDDTIVQSAAEALAGGPPLRMWFRIRNTDRTVGARLFREIAALREETLAPETVSVTFEGAAGQSFGAFMTPGVSFTLLGIANDYVGKGMAGGEIVVRPLAGLRGPSHEHVLLGNTVLYGATGGRLFAAGRAGERFAVRNSGAVAVVEGVGDHGCEYMTMGTVVVLGTTGRNFAAGMTGGEAFVLDTDGQFSRRCNPELVAPTEITAEDEGRLYALIEEFARKAGSLRAREILKEWPLWRLRFLRLAPKAERRALPSAQEEGSIA